MGSSLNYNNIFVLNSLLVMWHKPGARLWRGWDGESVNKSDTRSLAKVDVSGLTVTRFTVAKSPYLILPCACERKYVEYTTA